MPEFIEVEVFAGPNCSWEMTRIFQSQRGPRPVAQVVTQLQDGSEGKNTVKATGPHPAIPVARKRRTLAAKFLRLDAEFLAKRDGRLGG